MDISVVVPTRNRSRLLAMTLRSVLRQRDVDLEVIVVDEASTDDTPAMLAGFDDPRIRVVRHDRPLGVSAARNRGTAEARGDWVAFLDDDDLWAPTKLAYQLRASRESGRHWAYTGSVNIADTFRVVHGLPPLAPDDVVKALPRYNAIPGGGSNVVVRRTTLLEAGPFDTRLRNTEDWEMWIRIARSGPPAWVCRPLLAYRVHAANSSLDVDEILRGARLIEQLHDTTADWGRLHRWLAESCLRSRDRGAAVTQFAHAALRGQALGVARDIGLIARRRVSRAWGRRPDEGVASTWTEQAACWLAQLHEPD
jgi:glycosyltransferase involved in cell wall biosynthesis